MVCSFTLHRHMSFEEAVQEMTPVATLNRPKVRCIGQCMKASSLASSQEQSLPMRKPSAKRTDLNSLDNASKMRKHGRLGAAYGPTSIIRGRTPLSVLRLLW